MKNKTLTIISAPPLVDCCIWWSIWWIKKARENEAASWCFRSSATVGGRTSYGVSFKRSRHPLLHQVSFVGKPSVVVERCRLPWNKCNRGIDPFWEKGEVDVAMDVGWWVSPWPCSRRWEVWLDSFIVLGECVTWGTEWWMSDESRVSGEHDRPNSFFFVSLTSDTYLSVGMVPTIWYSVTETSPMQSSSTDMSVGNSTLV